MPEPYATIHKFRVHDFWNMCPNLPFVGLDANNEETGDMKTQRGSFDKISFDNIFLLFEKKLLSCLYLYCVIS